VGKNKTFSSFIRQNVKNGMRYIQSVVTINRKLHVLLIGTTIDDLG